MLTMAIIGLSYALWTVKERQARHPWMPKKLEPIAFRRPLELSSLGYLPKHCPIVAGLHIAEMMQDEEVGKKLLAEPRPEMLEWALKPIARTSGLTLEEIDHVVLGVMFEQQTPQLVMIVKARSKISLEKIAEARPAKSSLYQERPVYEFTSKSGDTLVWCVDDETLIYLYRLDAPKVEHLKNLPTKPRSLDEALSPTAHAVMKERLPKQAFAWAAGDLDALGALKLALPLMLGAKADFSVLFEAQRFAVSVAPNGGVTLNGSFLMKDAKASGRLKSFLEGVAIEGAKSQKVELPPADVEQWVSWQVRGDAAAIRGLVNGRPDEKK